MPIKLPGKIAETTEEQGKTPESTTNTTGAAKEQLETKQGTATVSKQNKKTKTEDLSEEKVGDVIVGPVGTLSVVTVEMSMTMNLGNYNSAKLGVHLAMPSKPDEIETTYVGAKMWVENKVNELVEAIKSED